MKAELEHVAIQSYDIQKTLHFYRDVLKLHPIRMLREGTGLIVWFDAGKDRTIEIFGRNSKTKRSKPVPQYSEAGICHFSLVVSDLEKLKKELARQGIRFREAGIEGCCKQVFVQGPDNEHIELKQILKP